MLSCDTELSTHVVYAGEDYPLNLVVKGSDGKRFDLTGITAQVAEFQNADGTILAKALTVVGSPLNGELSATLTDAETGALRIGERQSFQAILDFGSTRRIVVFSKALSVRSPPVS